MEERVGYTLQSEFDEHGVIHDAILGIGVIPLVFPSSAACGRTSGRSSHMHSINPRTNSFTLSNLPTLLKNKKACWTRCWETSSACWAKMSWRHLPCSWCLLSSYSDWMDWRIHQQLKGWFTYFHIDSHLFFSRWAVNILQDVQDTPTPARYP